MRKSYLIVLILSILVSMTIVNAEDNTPQVQNTGERIGIYDSRAVVIAFAFSGSFNKWMKELQVKYDKAKAAGDQKRVAELEAEGAARQKLMHKQGFSTAPVDNVLEYIQGALPEIKKKAGVTILLSKWDEDALAKHSAAELIDVTMVLVDAFHPNEKQRQYAIEVQNLEPIPIEQAEDINDWD